MYLTFASLSKWARLLNYDLINIVFKNNYLNLVAAAIWLMIANMTYTFFIFPAHLNNALLSNIVIQLDGHFFLNSTTTTDFKQNLTKQHFCLELKKRFLKTFNLVQCFLFVLSMNNIWLLKSFLSIVPYALRKALTAR